MIWNEAMKSFVSDSALFDLHEIRSDISNNVYFVQIRDWVSNWLSFLSPPLDSGLPNKCRWSRNLRTIQTSERFEFLVWVQIFLWAAEMISHPAVDTIGHMSCPDDGAPIPKLARVSGLVWWNQGSENQAGTIKEGRDLGVTLKLALLPGPNRDIVSWWEARIQQFPNKEWLFFAEVCQSRSRTSQSQSRNPIAENRAINLAKSRSWTGAGGSFVRKME
jgi:hypothetical protein